MSSTETLLGHLIAEQRRTNELLEAIAGERPSAPRQYSGAQRSGQNPRSRERQRQSKQRRNQKPVDRIIFVRHRGSMGIRVPWDMKHGLYGEPIGEGAAVDVELLHGGNRVVYLDIRDETGDHRRFGAFWVHRWKP